MRLKYTALSVAMIAMLSGCVGGFSEKEGEPVTVEITGQVGAEAENAKTITTPGIDADVTPEKSVFVAPASQPAVMPAPITAPVVQTRKLNIPTDPNTLLITAAPKTTEHPFYGLGKEMGFEVNGMPGHEISVTRGENYTFIVDTGVQHDFYLTTSGTGWGAGTYTEGVEGQFIYSGEVSFNPGAKTPDLLYYQCRNHKYMGGKIFVLDKDEDLAKLKASLDSSVNEKGSDRRNMSVVTESAIKQKLSYAQMVVGSSSAKRIEASGNAKAIDILTNAKAQVAAAQASLEAAQLDQAMAQVNEGLRLMTAASRQITTESEAGGVDQESQYAELSNSLKTYEGSYKRNIEQSVRMKQTIKMTLDQKSYYDLVDEGHSLAKRGEYVAANKSLHKAQALITAALTEMLHNKTVTYDNKFETAQEEYGYELARTENYEELIPLAIEQKRPSERAQELINSFVEKAAKIKAEGKAVAAKGDYKMAILAMQASTSNLQRALRMAGVN